MMRKYQEDLWLNETVKLEFRSEAFDPTGLSFFVGWLPIVGLIVTAIIWYVSKVSKDKAGRHKKYDLIS